MAIKQKFKVKNDRELQSSWQDDESWTNIKLEIKREKIMKQAYEIVALEDKKDFLRYLVINVLGRKK